MKTAATLVVAAVALLMHSAPATAQEDVLRPVIKPWAFIGGDLGMNFNMYSTDMAKSYEVPNSPFDAWKSGTGLSPYIGFTFDYVLTPDFGLVLRAAFDHKRFANEKTGDGQVLVWLSETDKTVFNVEQKLAYDFATSYIGLGLSFRANITPELYCTIGPVVDLALGKATEFQHREILTPGQAVFSDSVVPGNATILHFEDKMFEFERQYDANPSTRFGAEARLGYRLPLNKNILFTPFVGFQYWFTELIADRHSGDHYQRYELGPREQAADVTLSNSMLHSIQAGVGVSYALR